MSQPPAATQPDRRWRLSRRLAAVSSRPVPSTTSWPSPAWVFQTKSKGLRKIGRSLETRLPPIRLVVHGAGLCWNSLWTLGSKENITTTRAKLLLDHLAVTKKTIKGQGVEKTPTEWPEAECEYHSGSHSSNKDMAYSLRILCSTSQRKNSIGGTRGYHAATVFWRATPRVKVAMS